MVSNASEDFPLPESPVKTTILLRGISTLMFFRLCVRAPFITILPAPTEASGSEPCFLGFGINSSDPRFALGVGMGQSITPRLKNHGFLGKLDAELVLDFKFDGLREIAYVVRGGIALVHNVIRMLERGDGAAYGSPFQPRFFDKPAGGYSSLAGAHLLFFFKQCA